MEYNAETRDDRWPGGERRPATIEELQERLTWFRSNDSVAAAKNFRPRESDVFIATYPKCGTTWTQHIVHTLRTGGDLDFDEITEVVPWLESAHDLHIDPNAEQRANPRAFKTHLPRSELPQNARYIFITRDPVNVALSFFRFADGWMVEKDAVTVDSFVQRMFVEGTRAGTWWGHLLDWWPVRDQNNVLFLCYEDMIADAHAAITAIANFCAIAMTPELLETTLRYTSKEFMAAHRTLFDDHLFRGQRDPMIGFPPGGSSDKVSRADIKPVELHATSIELLQARWDEMIRDALGFGNYAELRGAIGGIPDVPAPDS